MLCTCIKFDSFVYHIAVMVPRDKGTTSQDCLKDLDSKTPSRQGMHTYVYMQCIHSIMSDDGHVLVTCILYVFFNI